MAKKEKQSRGQSWEEITPLSFNGKRYDEAVDIQKFGEDWSTYRLVGPVYALIQHWLPTIKKDGSIGAFPRLCLRNEDRHAECPYCEAGIRPVTGYLTNAISRELQEDEPKKKVKPAEDQEFKTKQDKVWTPIRVLQFSATTAGLIQSYKDINRVKKDGVIRYYSVSHPKYGCDLEIRIDSSATGAAKYAVNRSDRSPLTEEERAYLSYNIESVFEAIETYEEALETLQGLFDRGVFDIESDKTKGLNIKHIMDVLGIKKRKRKQDDDDEDEDEPKSKKPKSSKKKSRDEDEDDDLDDLDDEADDDEPKSKSKKSSKKLSKKDTKKSSKKKSRDEDDDDEEDVDDLDEDDEDDEPKSKSKKPKSSKKKSRDEDDDDVDDDVDDDDDDEEEDEDEKPSKKKSSKKSSKKKPRDDEEDDDDLDDLDDLEDEDDEDEKPSKKKSSKSRKR